MISLPLFAFLTGLYFAFLQFGYLILLQINISSAYLTYMTIVLSWMAGTVAGLWIKKPGPEPGVVLGALSYYGVYWLVTHHPFAGFTLFLSALGVGVTGIWAGRFFVVFLPRFAGPDRLFLHENNGFLAGIFLFFPGFALLGRGFLLWTPLLLAAVLILHHRRFIGFRSGPKASPSAK